MSQLIKIDDVLGPANSADCAHTAAFPICSMWHTGTNIHVLHNKTLKYLSKFMETQQNIYFG